MAGTKDKVVTVESLKALHEHNKETYIFKENPVGTGSLSMNRKANTNIGQYSTTEGYEPTASGDGSHAEGGYTTALGIYSHAEGYHTIANRESQHVQGKYNVPDNENKYAHIVGNGNGEDDASRSNAHTLDWDGNGWFAGDVYVGGDSQNNGTKLVKSTNVISIEYGDTLPAAGNKGRVFFKKLSE